MIRSTDLKKLAYDAEPVGDPTVIIKAKDVIVYVPIKRPPKKKDKTGSWPETMRRSTENEFGKFMGWNHCSAIVLKKDGVPVLLNRHFFDLEKNDFGKNLVFQIAVMQQILSNGTAVFYLELRRQTTISKYTQPKFKLKFMVLSNDVATKLPSRYKSQLFSAPEGDNLQQLCVPAGHSMWSLRVPQSPTTFLVIWSCKEPSKKEPKKV